MLRRLAENRALHVLFTIGTLVACWLIVSRPAPHLLALFVVAGMVVASGLYFRSRVVGDTRTAPSVDLFAAVLFATAVVVALRALGG